MPILNSPGNSELSRYGSSPSSTQTTRHDSSSSPSFFFSGIPGCYPIMSIKSLLPAPPSWTEATCPESGGGGPDKYDAFFPTRNRSNHHLNQSDGQQDEYDEDEDEDGRIISTRPQPPKRIISWAASSAADTATPRSSRSRSPSPTASIRQHSGSMTPPPTIAKEALPIRRQGSGAELTPIFECKMAECDGARKAREEAERQQRMTGGLDGPASSNSGGTNGGGGPPVPGFEMITAAVPVAEENRLAGRRSKQEETHNTEKEGTNRAKKDGANGSKKGEGTSRIRRKTGVIEDPFVVAVFLLVCLVCPPLGVYVVLREVDPRKHHGAKVVLATLLWVAGVFPGVIYAMVVLFGHLPTGANETAGRANS